MWFDSWSSIVRVVVIGTAAYVTLIVVLRTSGKRTLAKLNAFDLVVTVALGSTLATILLSSDVSWAEGAAALILLAVLQLLAALMSSRFSYGRDILTSRPTLLLRDGVVLDDALQRQRISAAELRQAIRARGIGDLGRVAAIVLETDGSMSVISKEQLGSGSSLDGVTEVKENRGHDVGLRGSRSRSHHPGVA